MSQFNRFFYGIVFSCIIAWTIYILTVDFYSIALVNNGKQSITSGPLPIRWTHFSSLLVANVITLVIIAFSMAFNKYKCQNLFD